MFQELKQKRFCVCPSRPANNTVHSRIASASRTVGWRLIYRKWIPTSGRLHSDYTKPRRIPSARGNIACVSCGKRRVFFSKSRLLSKERPLFQCGIENIEFQCGEPLFPEDFGVVSPDHTDFDKQKDFFERFVVNQNLSCDSPVEIILYKTTRHIICRICGVDL